jgi:hypothetical protein
VPGVGEEREAPRPDPHRRFDQHEAHGDDDGGTEGSTRRRVGCAIVVPVAALFVVMMVRMSVRVDVVVTVTTRTLAPGLGGLTRDGRAHGSLNLAFRTLSLRAPHPKYA